MEKACLRTTKIQANEIKSYGTSICYAIDVLLGVLLWRGRANVSIPLSSIVLNIWFPIHSVALFLAAILAIEFPTLTPTILLYSLAWTMATINYHGSVYPNPWKRCKSMHQENLIMILGHSQRGPIFIKPGEGIAEGEALDKLDAVKAERVQVFLRDLMSVGLKARRMYSKSNMQNISLETGDISGSTIIEKMVGSYLNYLHLMLYYMCTYLRMFRNLITSNSSSSHRFTMYLIFAGTFWLVMPMEAIILWSARAFAWTFLGPWMKLVDIWYVHQYYRTTEELKEDPVFRGTNLETLFASSKFQEMAKSVRIAAEDARKLKDMREHRFGKWSEVIPTVDMSRFPSVPSDASTAEPYLGALPPSTPKDSKLKINTETDENKEENGKRETKEEKGKHRGYIDIPKKQKKIVQLSGQKLEGNMVHTQMESSLPKVIYNKANAECIM
uniref:Uncharacterized protein n=1 Tax=Asterionellopsis glacialis TaxID=33640 RepID=A0A7S0KZP6_9STRA|mmetsp:Transcript_69/g.92  ORF Transcript_69/g.92 Transcript_69/m.92 type:complete len:443 (+) Transcript_69:1-1329(+)